MTLHDDEPEIIGHFILWLYTGEYSDLEGSLASEVESLNMRMIMQLGVQSAATVASENFVPESDPELVNELAVLHAKLYVLADKHGIADLASQAVREIKKQLEWDQNALLPALSQLFGTGQENHETTTRRTISKEQDRELWNILAEAASKEFGNYREDEMFSQVMLQNPSFQWELLQRVARNMETVEARLADVTANIQVPRLPKKRKNTNQGETQGQATKKKAKAGG